MGNKQRFGNTLLNSMTRVGIWDIVQRFFPNHLMVLGYHRVTDPNNPEFDTYLPNVSATPAMFAWQMDYIQAHFNVIDIDQLICWLQGEGQLPTRPVLITFDDGYADNFTHAFPELVRRNLPALIFITTDFIDEGSPFYWDVIAYCFHHTHKQSLTLPGMDSFEWENVSQRYQAMKDLINQLKQLPEMEKNQRVNEIRQALGVNSSIEEFSSLPLTWEQIRLMDSQGVAIGGHTKTHPILTKITLEQARDEIVASTNRIETEIQKRIHTFAYPNGLKSDFDGKHQQLLSALGYQIAFSLMPGPMPLKKARENPFAIRRIFISYKDEPGRFAAKLSPAMKLLNVTQ